jgi:hypothetical protein
MCGAYLDADPYVPEMKLKNGLIKVDLNIRKFFFLP